MFCKWTRKIWQKSGGNLAFVACGVTWDKFSLKIEKQEKVVGYSIRVSFGESLVSLKKNNPWLTE
jgi:hypothetical protein